MDTGPFTRTHNTFTINDRVAFAANTALQGGVINGGTGIALVRFDVQPDAPYWLNTHELVAADAW